MSNEKTFTVVGTAVNSDGTIKVRWANDLVSRLKILIKAKCTDIELIELPKAMTKLDAAIYLRDNRKLNAAQSEIISLKIGEKSRDAKRQEVKATLTKNVTRRVKSKKPTDPAVEKFVNEAVAKEEA